MTRSKSEELLLAYAELNWDSYVEIAEAITKINPSNIVVELTQHPTIFAYYNGLLSLAKKEADKAESALLNAQNIAKKRAIEAYNSKGKKATAVVLETESNLSDEVKKAESLAISTQFKYNLLKGLMQALQAKTQMIQQISANNRAETQLYS